MRKPAPLLPQNSPVPPQVPSGSTSGCGWQRWPPAGVEPGGGLPGCTSVLMVRRGLLGEGLSQDPPAGARGPQGEGNLGSGSGRGAALGGAEAGPPRMRVPRVRVRLPGRGPPRACACDRARPHTKRSESGIRIRSATLLRLLNTSCCRGRGRETCLPPTARPPSRPPGVSLFAHSFCHSFLHSRSSGPTCPRP